MDDAYTHSFYVHVAGYQVWPPSWILVAGVAAIILLSVTAAIVITLARPGSGRDAKDR